MSPLVEFRVACPTARIVGLDPGVHVRAARAIEALIEGRDGVVQRTDVELLRDEHVWSGVAPMEVVSIFMAVAQGHDVAALLDALEGVSV